MNTGSIRIEPWATCDVDRQMGENRFAHSLLRGMMERTTP
jgi:hypothetical protein